MEKEKLKNGLKIEQAQCCSCGLCSVGCAVNAISPQEGEINFDRCMGCFHCLALCPADAITFQGKIEPRLNPLSISSQEFESLIYSRRSHRKFLDTLIPDQVLLKIADLIRYSPTAKNSQAVYMTIINQKHQFKQLNEMIIRYYQQLTWFFNSVTVKLFKYLLPSYLLKLLKGIKRLVNKYLAGENRLSFDAPAVIIIHTPKKSVMPEADCNMAAMIGILYAEILGFKTCINGYMSKAINNSQKIKKSIAIPREHAVYSVILLGYSQLDYVKKVIREEAKVNIVS